MTLIDIYSVVECYNLVELVGPIWCDQMGDNL